MISWGIDVSDCELEVRGGRCKRCGEHEQAHSRGPAVSVEGFQAVMVPLDPLTGTSLWAERKEGRKDFVLF
jgi:hypothetical protein